MNKKLLKRLITRQAVHNLSKDELHEMSDCLNKPFAARTLLNTASILVKQRLSEIGNPLRTAASLMDIPVSPTLARNCSKPKRNGA